MTLIHKFFVTILPKKWAESTETESRAWMARCRCGFERSVWDIGGIRWKAAGKEYCYLSCPSCGRSGWHTIYKMPITGRVEDPRARSA